MTPLVSVKITTYNQAAYIRDAIEGALRQEVEFPYEIVIGEDCSTDGTREIVFEYRRRYPTRIRVITTERNVGARVNGRRTSEACLGKYLALCDGDDYWHDREKLRLQAAFMEDHDECSMVHGDVDIEYVGTGAVVRSAQRRVRPCRPTGYSVYCGVLDGSYPYLIYPCTVMIRRDLADRVIAQNEFEFGSGAFPMGDISMWLELARLGSIGYLRRSVACYRMRPGSLSHAADRESAMRFTLAGLRLREHYLQKYPVPDEWRRRCLEGMYRRMVAVGVKYGNEEVAARGVRLLRESGARVGFWEAIGALGAGVGCVRKGILLAGRVRYAASGIRRRLLGSGKSYSVWEGMGRVCVQRFSSVLGLQGGKGGAMDRDAGWEVYGSNSE